MWLGWLAGCVVGGPVPEGDDPTPDLRLIPDAQPMDSVPVFGGTLERAPAIDGFVAADPEGNRLLVVVGDQVSSIDLGPNARPFRILVEDETAWVTLRGTGELVQVDLDTNSIVWRTHVCLEPRGVARSPLGPLVVACADGPVVEVGPEGDILRSVFVAVDLRDVLAANDARLLYVSTFKSAEILALRADTLAVAFGPLNQEVGGWISPRVAWRMRMSLDGAVWLLHDWVTGESLPRDYGESHATTGAFANEWSAACHRLHETVVSEFSGPELSTVRNSGSVDGVILGTDFALDPEGSGIAFVSTGAQPSEAQVVLFPDVEDLFQQEPCITSGERVGLPAEPRVTAIAYDDAGRLIVQSAGPTSIMRLDEEQPLFADAPNAFSLPHNLFHQATEEAGVACASCHPEGLEDGSVWAFRPPDTGYTLDRRTFSLAGRLLSRAPYHWSGDLADPDALMDHTFTRQMLGREIGVKSTGPLFAWLDGLRPVRASPSVDEETIALGRSAFVAAGCDVCHSGPAFTDGELHYVRGEVVFWMGEEEALKTPSLLGVGTRQPLLHDGCALTLEERFAPPCDDGTDRHGQLSLLTTDELAALIEYVRTL